MKSTMIKGLTLAAAAVFATSALANAELTPVEEEAPARSDVSYRPSYGWTAIALGLPAHRLRLQVPELLPQQVRDGASRAAHRRRAGRRRRAGAS